MRKITRQACEAFIAGKTFQSGNTSTDGRSIYLHGNKIAARLNGDSDVILIRSCGWRTRTTQERLNGLIDCLQDRGENTRPRISFSQNSNDLISGEWERVTQ